jgi:hypothetical protein
LREALLTALTFTSERHGASRRFLAWELDRKKPVANAIPLKVSTIGLADVNIANHGSR